MVSTTEKKYMHDKTYPYFFQSALSTVNDKFKTESRKGVVILASAWTEFALEYKLRECFVKKTKNDFRSMIIPLTFGPKIELAYRVGLISAQLYDNLKKINNMRIKFAHIKFCKKGLNFIEWKDESIQNNVHNIIKNFYDVIKEFPEIRKNFPDGVDGDFQMALGIIIYDLTFRSHTRIEKANLEDYYKKNYKKTLAEEENELV